MSLVLLTISYGGTVSCVRGFETMEAAREAQCMVTRGMTLAQAAAADEAQRARMDAWFKANPNRGYIEMGHGGPSDGEIKRSFIFADPPTETVTP